MSAIGWPDVVIAFVVLFGALRGFKRGLVRELTGAVALAFGVAAAYRYPGMWDGFVMGTLHLGLASAHVVGVIAYAAVAYGIVLALGSILTMVAKLPLLGLGNAAFGAAVGAAKAVVFLWAIVYAALLFPLSPPVRRDLHRSQLVAVLLRPSERVDDALRSSLPQFVQPFADRLFSGHRV